MQFYATKFCLKIPYEFQAHIHHYTHVDGMEVSDFSESLESLNSIIKEYSDLEQQMANPPPSEPRLQVLSWRRIVMLYKVFHEMSLSSNHRAKTTVSFMTADGDALLGSFQKPNNKRADQSAQMRRLICTFVVRKPPMSSLILKGSQL